MIHAPLTVVTGGSSGIGKSVCRRLLIENFHVINADIKTPEEQLGEGYDYLECDITRKEHVKQLSELVQEIGNLQLLVLNAGRGIHEKIRNGDPEKWIEIININLCGTLRVLRALLPYMTSGNILFISSVSSLHPYPYGGVYAATKSALDTLAETLRQEELPDIAVSVINAGIVDTDFFSNIVSGIQTVESIGWGAIPPDVVADTVVFIVSQKKGAINNITIRPPGQVL